jgi:hypothetical protein
MGETSKIGDTCVKWVVNVECSGRPDSSHEVVVVVTSVVCSSSSYWA